MGVFRLSSILNYILILDGLTEQQVSCIPLLFEEIFDF